MLNDRPSSPVAGHRRRSAFSGEHELALLGRARKVCGDKDEDHHTVDGDGGRRPGSPVGSRKIRTRSQSDSDSNVRKLEGAPGQDGGGLLR